jgi:hypothetical protein
MGWFNPGKYQAITAFRARRRVLFDRWARRMTLPVPASPVEGQIVLAIHTCLIAAPSVLTTQQMFGEDMNW